MTIKHKFVGGWTPFKFNRLSVRQVYKVKNNTIYDNDNKKICSVTNDELDKFFRVAS